ncbi:major facilitator superfamily domain-containing protein [Lipomyces orientalis]|uniref:Major facilitator superfamily domain-containing protein n=1 Tax=Lipomyces orientalis TaxID=1233043 RepID=A0ACC3TKV3_9ASCO
MSHDEKPATGRAVDMAKAKDDNINIVYPSGLKLALLMISIFISMFLVSLDRFIISTTIPQITDASTRRAILVGMAQRTCSPTALSNVVWKDIHRFQYQSHLIVLFEVGSALCGAAENSIAFIHGIAIAGLGAGGTLSAMMVIIVFAVPPHKRPKYQGFFGTVFGVASVTGPQVCGAFITNVTWRWRFYINLPSGGVVMVVILFLLQIPDRLTTQKPLNEREGAAAQRPRHACHPSGNCCASAWPCNGVVAPCMREGRIIALLVLALVLLIVFALIQVWKPELATLLPRIFLQRIIASGFWGQWLGFQIVYGSGLGSCNQTPNMAAQTVHRREQVAIGASLMFFGQQLFGAVFTSPDVLTDGQNFLDNQLAKRLAGFPGISPQLVQNSGAIQLLNHVHAEDHASALWAYNESLRVCFQVGLIMACLAIDGMAHHGAPSKRTSRPSSLTAKNSCGGQGPG